MYHMVLTPDKNYGDSAVTGDCYGLCSRKIDDVLTSLRMRKLSVNNLPIVNIWERNFSKITIAFVAPRTVLSRSYFHETSRYLRVVQQF